MESGSEDSKKYYKFIFYFDHTTKKLFVYSPYTNRYTINCANKWSYVIHALILALLVGIVISNPLW
ncbi:hypothetical protein SAMN05216524_101409 [Mucilaginibacter sp. OK098]|nr:hypothetical protein SAMN05216524_101409 [Mucilaginibacter sp. OK098]